MIIVGDTETDTDTEYRDKDTGIDKKNE